MGRKVRNKGVYNSEVNRVKKVAMWVLGGSRALVLNKVFFISVL
jgi:hypothetical protein